LIALVTLVVADYDAAIAFFVGKLGFDLLEDTPLSLEGAKRWVRVAPPTRNGGGGTALLLARAVNDTQHASIGAQTGDRVAFFLHTDDFARDHAAFVAAGVRFVREPKREAYGVVAVFEDCCGNKWDLIEPARGRQEADRVR
jgi:catechol 2,3-dioxygenase-like lactoylglutathione lyase family enzyme